jgi:hypothetical protein
MTAPDWLTQRGGTLKLDSDRATWYVLFAGQPSYSLVVVPVDGKFGCVVRQANNGARIECAGQFATLDDAIRGGLDNLRKSLGWG